MKQVVLNYLFAFNVVLEEMNKGKWINVSCMLGEVDSRSVNNLGKPYIRLELVFCSKVTSKQTGGDTEMMFNMYAF